MIVFKSVALAAFHLSKIFEVDLVGNFGCKFLVIFSWLGVFVAVLSCPFVPLESCLGDDMLLPNPSYTVHHS
jgi:hypothetical protein